MCQLSKSSTSQVTSHLTLGFRVMGPTATVIGHQCCFALGSSSSSSPSGHQALGRRPVLLRLGSFFVEYSGGNLRVLSKFSQTAVQEASYGHTVRLRINTTFFRKIYNYFRQNATIFRKPNSALFGLSHCSRRRSEAMCLCRRDWLLAPTIRYQFKRRLFSRRPCTGPHLWAAFEIAVIGKLCFI